MQEEQSKQGPSFRERLWVVGIALVVLSVLVPGYLDLRRRSLNASCLSNMREMSSALRSYMLDWDETLPLAYYRDKREGDKLVTWTMLLGGYLDAKRFYCPADPQKEAPPYIDLDSEQKRHVSYGFFLPASGVRPSRLPAGGSQLAVIADSAAEGVNTHPLPDIPPEQQALFLGFDTPDNRSQQGARRVQRLAIFSRGGNWDNPRQLRTRHGNTINMLFADGHVGEVPASVLIVQRDTDGKVLSPWSAHLPQVEGY
ncbi:MAG: hypothetical protein RMK92_09575 [Armatimonadota bacterium]|nr:hypothetical protein [Armatimonadota bacterium]